VWRGSRPFDADEQEAILLAAARDVSWARRATIPTSGRYGLYLLIGRTATARI
jgi:hypothetical protein